MSTPKSRPSQPVNSTKAGKSPSSSNARGAGAKPLAKSGPRRTKRPAKSHLTRKDLRKYLELLLVKRKELVGDVASMSDEALRHNDASNLSRTPLHMADLGTDNYEQELTLGLVETERQTLREVDMAMERIDDGTFGICQKTGKAINKSRLNATPWARYCIEAARQIERHGNS